MIISEESNDEEESSHTTACPLLSNPRGRRLRLWNQMFRIFWPFPLHKMLYSYRQTITTSWTCKFSLSYDEKFSLFPVQLPLKVHEAQRQCIVCHSTKANVILHFLNTALSDFIYQTTLRLKICDFSLKWSKIVATVRVLWSFIKVATWWQIHNPPSSKAEASHNTLTIIQKMCFRMENPCPSTLNSPSSFLPKTPIHIPNGHDVPLMIGFFGSWATYWEWWPARFYRIEPIPYIYRRFLGSTTGIFFNFSHSRSLFCLMPFCFS